MESRRSFLQKSLAFTGAIYLNPISLFKHNTIGVQLYTLREEVFKDPKDTLAKVSALGYTDVETFGYKDGRWFGLSVAEMKETLQQYGLTSRSGHTFPASIFLKNGWEPEFTQAAADAAAIGQEFIVIPYLEPAYQNDIQNYIPISAGLNKAGRIAREHGIQLAYHNHDFEFKVMEGKKGMDIILKETDPSLVAIELDLYWAVKADIDVISFFKKNKGRVKLWHVKDMDNTEQRAFTEVGNGTIDFKKIFKAARKSGMKYFYVEQDVSKAPLQSIETSIRYLKSNIL